MYDTFRRVSIYNCQIFRIDMSEEKEKIEKMKDINSLRFV